MADAEAQVTENQAKPTAGKNSRPKLRKALPTDRVAFAKQLDILRGAAAASGPGRSAVSNEDVAKVVNIHFGSVSTCNPFFLETGLMSRQKFQNIPSDEVFAYAERFEWEQEKAAHKLAPVLRRSWFYSALSPKLAFRSLSTDEAISFLAEEVGAAKEHKDQLAILLDYLRVSGLITVDGTVISLNKNGTEEAVPAGVITVDLPAPKSNSSEDDGIGRVGLNLDPLLLALLQKIPDRGNEWPAEKRLRWFRTFAMNVSQVYDEDDAPVELKIEKGS